MFNRINERSWVAILMVLMSLVTMTVRANDQRDSLQAYISRADDAAKLLEWDAVQIHADALRSIVEVGLQEEASAYANLYEAHIYKRSDIEKALVLAQQALTYFEAKGDLYRSMTARMAIGNCQSNAGKQLESYKTYTESIAYARSQKNITPEIESMCLRMAYNAGFSMIKYGDLDKAAKTLSDARDIAISLRDTMVLAHVYNQFGNVALRREDYQSCIDYNRKGLVLTAAIDSKSGIYMEGAIGAAYGEMGVLDSAAYYLQKVASQWRSGNNQYSLAVSLLNLSEVYRKQDDCNRSSELNKEVISIATTNGQEHLLLDANINLCSCALQKKDYHSAYSYYASSEPILLVALQYDIAKDLYKCGADAAEGLGRNSEALALYKRHKLYTDSLINQQSETTITELEKKYDFSQKEAEVLALEAAALKTKYQFRQRSYWFVLGGLLLLLFALGLYYISSKKLLREEQKRAEIERKLLRIQMNPHFIFNAISSIQNFLFDKSDLKVALTYLSKFAELMRQTLENSREVQIPLDKEIASLKNYLELQQLRYQNKFTYELVVDADLKTDEVMVPPLIAQPFVENAIEHGQIYRVDNGVVKVAFTVNGDELRLTVEDNGIGLRQHEIEKLHQGRTKKSLATTITRERLGILSKQSRKKFDLIVEQLQTGGTLVTIGLPKMYIN